MLKRLLGNRIVSWILAQLGPVPGAIQKNVNLNELLRIALTAGLLGGGVTAILPALVANLNQFVAPINVGLVTTGIAFVTELDRRLKHGQPASSTAVR